MSTLLRPLLLLAVLLRAAWLRLSARPAAPAEGAAGWRDRFRLAVWLALAVVPARAQEPLPPTVMCYDMMAPGSVALQRPLARVRVLWMALDPVQGPALQAALKAASAGGEVEVPVAGLLLRIHRELAGHRDRTRNPQVTCYRISDAGARTLGHREAALVQLEALARVRAAGQVAPEVLERAEAALRAELAGLDLKPAPKAVELQKTARLLVDWYSE